MPARRSARIREDASSPPRRRLTGKAGVPFFSSATSVFGKLFFGVGASRERDLFEKDKGPFIVFVGDRCHQYAPWCQDGW